MSNMLKVKTALLLVTLFVMTACGYQLRQPFTLPAEYTPVQIQVPRQYRQLRATLEEQLRLSFVPVAKQGEKAGLLIRLEDVREDNELLTASAEGSPLERELILRASVRWVDAAGKEVLEKEDFRLRRAYAYDDRAILAKAREAEFLMAELERDLAQRIVIRLRQLSETN